MGPVYVGEVPLVVCPVCAGFSGSTVPLCHCFQCAI